MKEKIYFVSSNKVKIAEMMYLFDNSLEVIDYDCQEIQGSPEEVCKDKLLKAQKKLEKDIIVVCDDFCVFEGLYDFPGVYLKDFLRMGFKKIESIVEKVGRRFKMSTILGLYYKGDVNFFYGSYSGYIHLREGIEDQMSINPLLMIEETGKFFTDFTFEELCENNHRKKAAYKLKEYFKSKNFDYK